MFGPHFHHHHHHPHGILNNIMPHNPIVRGVIRGLLKPEYHAPQNNVNINIYQQPQYPYREPDYKEEEEEPKDGTRRTPMSTDEYFRLKKQLEDEMRREKFESYEKKKEQKSDDKKTEDIKDQNNNTQQPPLNQQEEPAPTPQPAPPSNQQPVLLPSLNDIITNK